MTELPSIAASDLSALPALLTVAEVAEVLRVGRSWVYEHAAELGAVKLGSGQSAPLRIPRDGVREILGLAPAPPPVRRSVGPGRLREATPSSGELRARPRL
jgi:excisionase family DNA binding protein